MKKRLMTAFGIIIGIGVLVFGLYYSNSSQNDPTLTKDQIKSLVSEQYPGELTKLELKTKKNQPIYEALVTNKETTYDITLDGHSGEVLDIIKNTVVVKNDPKETKEQPKTEKKQEPNNKQEINVPKSETPKAETQSKTETKPKAETETKSKTETKPKAETKSQKEKQPEPKNEVAQKPDKPKIKEKKDPPKQKAKVDEKPQKKPQKEEKKTSKKTETKTVLSIAEVRKIALQHFSGEIDEIELENEDGRQFYEVEIERGEQEAELKIDAYTGDLIVIEIEED